MLSAMNADNLSCAFCFLIYCYQAFVTTLQDRGTLLWAKGLSCEQKKG